MSSRSKQLEEVETTVLGVNSNYDDTVTNISSASPKGPVNGSAEPRSKRTIRRPAYWLEMRGMKNSVNKSSEKKGTYHCSRQNCFSLWFFCERLVCFLKTCCSSTTNYKLASAAHVLEETNFRHCTNTGTVL